MRVTVQTSQIMNQLPKELRYAIIAGCDGVPESFVLDVSETTEESRVMLGVEHPEVKSVITNAEWILFTELLGKEQGVARNVLTVALDTHRKIGPPRTSNVVDVHIKNLRKRLTENKLPYQIQTVRGSPYMDGGYKLIEV